jgi:hypothetical protein
MTKYFIPCVARPQVTQSLAREAWALAAALEARVGRNKPVTAPRRDDSNATCSCTRKRRDS